jgi:hypothetical protein
VYKTTFGKGGAKVCVKGGGKVCVKVGAKVCEIIRSNKTMNTSCFYKVSIKPQLENIDTDKNK